MEANCSELNFGNANLTELVLGLLGPKCLEHRIVIITEVLYSIILICGVTGNLCTCFVIVRNSSMHTATNYYLFSLAVSDLISLVLGIPFELYSVSTEQYPYRLPLFVCKGRAFITEMTTYASILTILAFSVERWLAICFPFKFKKFSKLSRAIKVISIVWVIAFASAFPVWYYHTINAITLPPEQAKVFGLPPNWTIPDTSVCYLDWNARSAHDVIINCSFWLFFVLPMCIMVYLYAYIGVTILNAEKLQYADPESHRHTRRQVNSRKVVIRMLVAVVTAFFICWLPFHLQRLATVYVSDDMAKDSPILDELLRFVFYISGYFYYSNSALNPLLYSILNRKFRKAVVSTVCYYCCFGRSESGSSSQLPMLRNAATGTSGSRSPRPRLRPVSHGEISGLQLDCPSHASSTTGY